MLYSGFVVVAGDDERFEWLYHSRKLVGTPLALVPSFGLLRPSKLDNMPGTILAHTGRENVKIWGDILLQQNLTIYTLAGFVGIGFVYCIFTMFTLSFFAWSQTRWYDQMAEEIFHLPPTQTTGLFWCRAN
ncbi:hypothetical protein NKJ55_34185 [Mesorhizobium sp. M0106]|uniref:hypothetical protein n=1 Tax=Mesorhizobium sp. M0106 TaxID=2956880 RepID=UPI0033398DCD